MYGWMYVTLPSANPAGDYRPREGEGEGGDHGVSLGRAGGLGGVRGGPWSVFSRVCCVVCDVWYDDVRLPGGSRAGWNKNENKNKAG